MKGASALAALLAAALALTGCGEGGGRPALAVSAAASLQRSFSRYAQQFAPASVHLSFAGSDALAAQIEQGLRPDIFASADTALPDTLYAKGLAERPVVFVANRLVLAVPKSSRGINGLADLERPGVTIALGAQTVPVGAYTQVVLSRLPPGQRRALLAHVRDAEPDVGGIVGKLTQGAVDAGFLYATDVAAAGAGLRAIQLPGALQPEIRYGVAVVKGTQHAAQAHAFVVGLLRGAGRRDLLAAGFLPPPAP